MGTRSSRYPKGPTWEPRRLEALARSLLDGLAVWGRETQRPRNEQSPTIIQHELERSRRMVNLWESEIDHPIMRASLNMAQITLGCALGLEDWNSDFRWRPHHPKLRDWYEPIAARPSFAVTIPPTIQKPV